MISSATVGPPRGRLTVGGREADDPVMTTLERAEAAEHALSQELDRMVVKSVIYVSGEHDPRVPIMRPPDNGKLVMMGHDPRLPKMPDKPTLIDFFKYRFGPANHLLQSARLAMKNGVSEKIVLACLVHDIAIAGFIRGDHGYWAAQLLEPYVDEEVAGPSAITRPCASTPTSRSATSTPSSTRSSSARTTCPTPTSSATISRRATTSGT